MLKISNINVYDLEESIVASGYAMGISLDDFKGRIDNLKYWLSFDNFLPDFVKYLNNKGKDVGENTRFSCKKCGAVNGNKKYNGGDYYCRKHISQIKKYGKTIDSPEYILNADESVTIKALGKDGVIREAKISSVDLPLLFGNSLSISKKQGYIITNGKKKTFQSILKECIGIYDENIVLDHIDKNGSNNLRENLRICLFSENMRNQNRQTPNISGVVWDTYHKKWKAQIFINYRAHYIGRYETKEEAIKARLLKEAEMFGEYSPNVELFEKYGIDVPKIEHVEVPPYSLNNAVKDFKRILRLHEASANSNIKCHDNWLTGVRVSFDLIYPQYISPELQRYHWVDIVTSSSKMHRLSKMKMKDCCNEYVTNEIIEQEQKYIDEYNKNSTYENFMKALSNCPLGLQLFEHIDTNYMQLKTIYNQRKNHKLKEDWGEFCKFVESLPYAKELILGENGDQN